MDDLVLYEHQDGVAVLTMNIPDRRNAQGAALTYALDDAFHRFAQDDSARVAVLAGAGPHFSAGHDVLDNPQEFEYSPRSMWAHPAGKPGVDWIMHYEEDAFLGMCRRWREIPKPTIAMVHGACIGGALALMWSCDLVVASNDAFFSDPVVAFGCPGIEYFYHPWAMGSRVAREFLFTGERMSATRAYEVGMINRVVPRKQLEAETRGLAAKMVSKPRFGMTLAKLSLNEAEDAMGLRMATEAAFSNHQLAHAHNLNLCGSPMLADGETSGGDMKTTLAKLKAAK